MSIKRDTQNRGGGKRDFSPFENRKGKLKGFPK